MSYFEIITFVEDEGPSFNGHPTPSTHAPDFDILGELRMSTSDFVDKANRLFDECSVKVPSDYPKLKVVKRKYFSKAFESNPMDDFAICVGSCILKRNSISTFRKSSEKN